MNNLRIVTVLLALVAVTTVACDGCSEDTAQDAEQRVDSLASHHPADADAALVVPELSDLPANLDRVFRRADHVYADARQYEQTLNRSIGFPTTAEESWDAAGFDTDGSLMLSLVGSRPVLTAHIDDENSFETHVIGHLRERVETETPIEDQDFGEQTFRVSGAGLAHDMAWYYDDSVVVLIMPPYEALEGLEGGSATDIAERIGPLQKADSLAENGAFQEYRRGVGGDYPVSLYMHPTRYLERPEVEGGVGIAALDSVARTMVEWSSNNADTTGVGFRADDQSIQLHGFAGADDEVLGDAREALSADADPSWNGMLTEHTTAAAKTSLDLSRALDTYKNNLPEDRRQQFDDQIDQLGRNYELDMREDVVDAISGHSLLVFYGVGGDIDQATGHLLGPRPNPIAGARAFLENSGLLFNFHFEDQQKKDRLLDQLVDFAGNFVQRRNLTYEGEPVDDAEVFQPVDLDTVPVRLFSHNQSSTLASAGINEESTYEYLTDRREETGLAETDNRPLGSRFATSDRVNGLYLNIENLQSNLRQLGTSGSAAANFLDSMDELLLTAGVEDDGFRADAELTFTEPLQEQSQQ